MSDWDRVETDVLFELCERFGLRFINITDRLPVELEERIVEIYGRKREKKLVRKEMSAEPRRERTVDEVKDRYYSVARAILTHQGCKILTRPFDAEAEMRRKKDLEQMQMRTK